MKFPKMHKPSFMASCLAMALVGCDEKHPELPDPGGRVSTQMSFSLPGSLFRLETKHNESTNGKLDYYFSPTIWRPQDGRFGSLATSTQMPRIQGVTLAGR